MNGRLEEWYLLAYLGAFVIQSQASKYAAFRRDNVNQGGSHDK
ncbi:TPA: hypothetical protein ACHWKL_003619 [Providencia stuartii]